MIWTVNAIDAFRKVSSSYKISFEQAFANDLSSIFGDYTYVFGKKVYRKSKYSSNDVTESNYFHTHYKYGSPYYEGLSLDGENFEKMHCLETPLLDCGAFEFKQDQYKKLNEYETEIIEVYSKSEKFYRLSYLLLRYLLRIHCYSVDDMYYSSNLVVEKSFGIVNTVRRQIGGEKYYLLPCNKKPTTYSLIEMQFGNASHIFSTYKKKMQEKNSFLLCKHDS